MTWQKLIFWVLLLCLPLNLGKHWIFSFSYVRGLLVDYLVPVLYTTDIPLVLLGLMAVRGRLGRLGRLGVFLAFLFFALLSGLGAPLPTVFWWRWTKLLFYVLFFFWVKEKFDWKKDFSKLFWVLLLPALGESLLAIWQWWQQFSIFGYLPFGGPVYRAGQPGLATVVFLGAQKVRSYGTFPHPNALGGYLAVVLVWIVWGIWQRRLIGWKKGGVLVLVLLGGLFFSFSRSAWWVAGVDMLLFLGSRLKGKLARSGVVLLFLSLFLGTGWYLGSQLGSYSWLRRGELLTASLKMLPRSPWLGIGLGQFTAVSENYYQTSELIRFVQPVHNLYFLVLAEIGVLGSVGLWLGVTRLMKRLFSQAAAPFSRPLLLAWGTILVLGLVDHYWWTLPQTSLLFWLTLGLVASYTGVDPRLKIEDEKA
ncbi:MAG: O-antigen ligase family protein [bacterium]|nr:O-antigen ligase family protein [bacterium]